MNTTRDASEAPTTLRLDATHMDRDDTPWLLQRYAATGDRRYAEAVMEVHEGLAVSRARKMWRAGVEMEDLLQVARMAMWTAIQRYDADKGASFATFATRTMDGELKRYYRDRVWSVHVPRGLKQTSLQASRARRRYVAEHGLEPSTAQLARFADMDTQQVERGLRAAAAYRSDSLDAPVAEGGRRLHDTLVAAEPQIEPEELMDLWRAARRLPPRQRRIVHLSFFEDMTQREIAAQIGCSQMHVSRLLRRALTTMKQEMSAGTSTGTRTARAAA